MFLLDHLPEHYSLQQASVEILVIIVGAMILGFLLGYSFAVAKGHLCWLGGRNLNKAMGQDVDLDELRKKASKKKTELKFDNFQRLLGIDGYTQQLLYHYGIRTYEDLEQTNPKVLKAILNKAGGSYSKLNPGNWPIQAKISAMGNWKQLVDFQYKILNR